MTFFHYTDIDAFLSIVTSGRLRFGSLAFMNDHYEGYEYVRVLVTALKNEYGLDSTDKLERLAKSTVETWLRHIFLFCASAKEDDLGQWRAYTTLGRGVCLEFENGFAANNEIYPQRCIYHPDEKEAAVKSIAFDGDSRIDPTALDSSLEGLMKFVLDLVLKAPRFKSATFSGEEETRWTIIDGEPFMKKRIEVQYRPHRLGLSPYLEVPIDLTKLKKVTLGPQVPNLNKGVLEDFLDKIKCSAFVAVSRCPLR